MSKKVATDNILSNIEIRSRSDLRSDLLGAWLIIGNEISQQAKVKEIVKLDPNNLDLRYIEPIEGKRSIGIDQIKDAIKYLAQKPFAGKTKTVIIYNAEHLTIEAQNALLKTLEEPPAYATIILCSATQDALLPTVQSRCQKLWLKESDNRSEGVFKTILDMPIGEKLSFAEETSKEEKGDIIDLLESWIIDERKEMLEQNLPNADKKRQNLEKLLEVKMDIEKTNVNVRLALEYLTIHLL